MPLSSLPSLTSFSLTPVLDVTKGDALLTLSADAVDDYGITDISIWLDKSVVQTSFLDSFGIAVPFWLGNSATWVDGHLNSSVWVKPETKSGSAEIMRIELTDMEGNKVTYDQDDLRAAGFTSSVTIVGGSDIPPPVTHAELSIPDAITLREGQSLNVGLLLKNMASGYTTYSYDISTAGGAASFADIGSLSGQGSYIGWGGRTERIPMTITALRDTVAEGPETAFLVVNVSGTEFSDGGSMKVVEITILDDNLTDGTNGRDTLRGTSAAEVLTGGRGDDSYYVTKGDQVVEDANGGRDHVFSALDWTLGDNLETLTLTGQGAATGRGNAADNVITGNGAANVLEGLGGNDTLKGGAGADTLRGGNGNDVLNGDGGNDVLFGGSGDDGLYGGDGNDRISGDGGADRLSGQNGNDTLSGGDGNDILKGDNGADQLSGGAGADMLYGGAGADVLSGDNGADTLTGGAGHDRLLGGAGNDVLNADAGNDTLYGGAGNDVLSGGAGRDVLYGGAGVDELHGGVDQARDTFIFLKRSDFGSLSHTDEIHDFVSGIDRIDVSAIDANIRAAGHQSFVFSDSGPAANALWTTQQGSDLLLQGDVNKDGAADFALLLRDVQYLASTDVML
ncbi:calcium-binding protein [Falsirhodobacter algicola]|uniref:Hemolysin type calcium-binding protein n=1 Tax=Falsirhodobacter algicola TaxID=2692330 RepID=A0A8J8MSS3_9RHOB|nr:calcium-binding protein [Falsirhodobacter algicola]QUS35633.1 hypothetical protein GR316_04725 [Falsirhodobacter algicola]